MKHDEILQAAKEVGLVPVDNHIGMKILWWSVSAEDLQLFAKIIERKTIERCKEECDYVSKNARPSTVSYAYKTGADECAAAIRKLGEQ